jgi:hypothetical protein
LGIKERAVVLLPAFNSAGLQAFAIGTGREVLVESQESSTISGSRWLL